MIDDNALHKRTQDAYSFDSYGPEAWMNAIRLLAPFYTEEEVEWILRSKYMRWAADEFGARKKNPDDETERVLDGTEIIKYRDKWGIKIEEDE